MKANELMLNDWVRTTYNLPDGNKPTQIEKIHSINSVQDGFIDCKPIYLTEDMLKTNMYLKKSEKTYQVPFFGKRGSFIYITPYALDITGELVLFPAVDGVIIYCRYVHELQHALRLCGLNDLADNFKLI